MSNPLLKLLFDCHEGLTPMKTLLTTLIPLALLSACSGADTSGNSSAPSKAGAVAAPAGTDWLATVAQTPEGGFVQGNPNAAVKLIEYGALTCSHCAEFAEKSAGKLSAYVAKGTVSYEFRNFLLNVMDVPAATLARCGGPGPYFQITEQMFASQRDWASKAQTITPDEQQALSKMTPLQTSAMLASKLELDKFVQQRGIGADQVKACLSDQKALDALGKITEEGQAKFQITGTPTFIINGQVLRDANTWESLEPKLKDAGA
jgi:protein-disulfide isomerase